MTICGDGITVDAEIDTGFCDDGNSVDADG